MPMQHIYSPEEYLKFEEIQEELKELELTQSLDNTLRPNVHSINTILNYSKSLEIRKSKWLGQIENINN
jgi:hypothetical protein